MKTKQLSKWLLAILFASSITMSCSKDDKAEPDSQNEFPERLTVNIPSELSAASSTKNSVAAADDRFDGKAMYANLRVFIGIAQSGAQFLDAIMDAIRIHQLNQPMDIEFADNDDSGRTKHLVVEENKMYEGAEYRFRLNLTDVADETSSGDGLGMQIFWSGNPVRGIAILKQKHLNHVNNDLGDAVIKIEYSEAQTSGYDATMIVSISGIAMKNPSVDKFSADRIKLFVGKKGDIYDLFGNSNHPNGYLGTSQPAEIGLNYAFVASADDANNRAVAEIGLPPMSLVATTKSEIINKYSIRNVIVEAVARDFNLSIVETENHEYFINSVLDIDPPAFFANGNLVSTGTAPSSDYGDLITRKDALSPYSPKAVSGIVVEFGK